jgi:beta-galactosidase
MKEEHVVELRARAETVVHINAFHGGLGTASVGPDTLPEYRIPTGKHRGTWTLHMVGGNNP